MDFAISLQISQDSTPFCVTIIPRTLSLRPPYPTCYNTAWALRSSPKSATLALAIKKKKGVALPLSCLTPSLAPGPRLGSLLKPWGSAALAAAIKLLL